MGKAKKRNFHTCIKGKKDLPVFTREEAVSEIIKKIKTKKLNTETKDLISLFGITAEELTEAGAVYEDLKALGVVLQ